MGLLNIFAKRFVAGETAEEAAAAARRANEKGITAILDYLGEDVSSAADAQKAAEEYMNLLRLIDEHHVLAAVSLKVSQMGILISRDVCVENIRRVVQEAARLKRFVWFDMEGSALTQKTIEVFDAIRQDFPNVGLCLQACLVRTGGDVDQLMRNLPAGRECPSFFVRLCKGAYKEPAGIAYTAKSAVEGNFRMLVQKMFDQIGRGIYPALATHDGRLIDYIIAAALDKKVSQTHFEFQMLYGIQNKRLASLAAQHFRASVYIPYGTHWLPYFTRRLRERKENLYFLLRNVFQS